MSAHERTGWRDLELSRRHREWYGKNCPMVDLDFLVCEYDSARPAGIVEYKHIERGAEDFTHPTYKAIGRLADAAQIPFIVAYYTPPPYRFFVIPMNDHARAIYKRPTAYTEQRFVRGLYFMRSRIVEAETIGRLDDVSPDDVAWPAGLVEDAGHESADAA